MTQNEIENGYEPLPSDNQHKRERIGCLAIICFAAIGFVALGLFLPAVFRDVRPARYRMVCSDNLRQLASAILNYEHEYKQIPPAFTVDDKGNPLHSWRALILPFIGRPDLYQRIDFSKPWNDPVNQVVGKEVVSLYHCPANSVPSTNTTYVAVISDNTCWLGKNGRALSEITDPHWGTLLVYECNTDQAVHWMEPRDITSENALIESEKSKTAHSGVRHVVFLDSRVRLLPIEVDRKLLEKMLTIDGNEPELELSP